VRNFSGGANAFFTLMWTSAITGYESISDHISFLQSPAELDAAIASVAGDRATVQSLVEDFLQGSGIPCPEKFEELKGGFSTLIDLDKIDTPGFRARVFTWAATGSPTISPDDTRRITVSTFSIGCSFLQKFILANCFFLQIGAVADDDQLYADRNVREMMLLNGKISFRTCMSHVRLPASFITTLTSRTYPSISDFCGPSTFQEAFSFWFLTEILSAIRGHSML
jgi:hypothetical protein